jgi:glutaminyl-tRNA synthetase
MPIALAVMAEAKRAPSLAGAKLGDHYQFERVGYFVLDPDTTNEKKIFNRTMSLKDAWAKIEKKAGA